MKLLLKVLGTGGYQLSLPNWMATGSEFVDAVDDKLTVDKDFVYSLGGPALYAYSRGDWNDDEAMEHAQRVADTLDVEFDLV